MIHLPDFVSPNYVTFHLDGSWQPARLDTSGNWICQGASMGIAPGDSGGLVLITCPTGALSGVNLRWDGVSLLGCRLLGDAWERSYGDLEW